MRKILLLCAFLTAGCSGVKNVGGTGGTAQNAVVSGPYSAVATSNKGNGVTNVYTNLSIESSSSFSASRSTLVCPGNIPGNCIANTPTTLSGTVNGNNLQITLQFTNASGPDTVTLMQRNLHRFPGRLRNLDGNTKRLANRHLQRFGEFHSQSPANRSHDFRADHRRSEFHTDRFGRG